MLRSQIEPGVDYAFRLKNRPGAPVERVTVLGHIRGKKWKVKWIDPNPGLTDFVESVQLLARWRERGAFLQEETNRERLVKHHEELGYDEGSPIAAALYWVFESTGEGEISFYKGSVRGGSESIKRLKERIGMSPDQRSPYAFEDRLGTLYLPYDEALEIAKQFCAAEPQAVLINIEASEREDLRKARTPGRDYLIGLVNASQASWALIRQWTGHDPAVKAREEHIQKLERLVWDAIYALQKAGQDSEAARLRRALGVS